MILDPTFYFAAIPAVVLTGLAKGGFGGAFVVLAMPLLSLVISPLAAAGIMLPILLVMDVISVWAWRRVWDGRNLAILLPSGLVGTGLGWATASLVTDAHIRLMVGVIGLGFAFNWLVERLRRAAAAPPQPPDWRRGWFWGTICGFTSFISHVGGPPVQIYLLPQRLSKEVFAGTLTMLFAALNVVKVGPFLALGQLNADTLATSAALLPVAIVSTIIGTRIVRHVPTQLFFQIITVALALVSLKLIWDGLVGIGWL